MGLDLTLKINNVLSEEGTSSQPVRIFSEQPVLTWDFNQLQRSSVDEYTGIISDEADYGQAGYEIRISTSFVNIGTDSFIGNRVQTGYVDSQERFWKYVGIPLQRESTYYGQIKVTDDADRESGWITFLFNYNALPSVSDAKISPDSPTPESDLSLSYTFEDNDGDEESGTLIRWYKNGSYQRQHDNSTLIESIYLQNGDIWSADIYPSDGYEYGVLVSVPHVKIQRVALVVSDVHILPFNPTDNDILKVDYEVDDLSNKENINIRWYINDKVQTDYNDQQYIRPDVVEGDVIGVEVKSESSSQYVSASDVIIQSSLFVVSDIKIDGRIEPLDISTMTPTISWNSYVPSGKTVNYVSINIGTFYEASNIYSSTVAFTKEVFTVPSNILQKGRDYYISIAMSDSQEFEKYFSSHFRVAGSRWEESVSNFTGWTIEAMMVIEGSTTGDNDYHVVRIYDGSYFAEIQIGIGKISFISGEMEEYESDSIKENGTYIITVAGQNDNIKIYLNRELVIDGSGLFTQETSVKRLEIGSMSSNFEIDYKYISYTVSGYYLPAVSSEYANLQFHTLYEFSENEVVALRSYVNGEKIFAINPDNTNENASIYSLVSGYPYKCQTTTRTYSPINKMHESPDKKYVACAHASGVTLISGYTIGTYDHETIFIDANGVVSTTYPDSHGWELVKDTSYNGVHLDSSGLHINTI